MAKPARNTICLWYDGDAEGAARFYAKTFPDSSVGAVILGISPDDPKSHAKFAEKFALPFPLLSDPGHTIAESYGVWKEKNMYGKKVMGIVRTTFVIGADGRIAGQRKIDGLRPAHGIALVSGIALGVQHRQRRQPHQRQEL